MSKTIAQKVSNNKWYAKRRENPPEPPPYTHKICTACKQDKPLSSFRKNVTYKDTYSPRCMSCSYNLTEKKSQDKWSLKNWAKHLVINVANRHCRNHQATQPCDLTEDFVLGLFAKQNGRCYWLGVPLIPTKIPKHPQKPSLDRLDITKGYTKDNVVLSCLFANMGRNDLPQEIFTAFRDVLMQQHLLKE